MSETVRQLSSRRSFLAGLWAGIAAIFGTMKPKSTRAQTPSPAGGKHHAGKAGIHPWIEIGQQITVDIAIDGEVVAHLDHKAVLPGLKKLPAVVFDLPAGLKQLQLRGSFIDAEGRITTFTRTWTVRDIAEASAPLYDQTRPLIERIRNFAGMSELVQLDAPRRDGGVTAEAAFRKLETRLGVQLPAPLRQILSSADINVEDSSFLSPPNLVAVTELLLSGWGYTRSGGDIALDKLVSATVLARYDRSVAVFVEVGDGLGALAWDPAGVTSGEPPNTWGDKGNPGAQPSTPNDGVWFWLHQEHISEPELLLDDDYRPKDAEAALIHVFQRFCLSQIDSPESESELVIDSNLPRNLLQLHFEDPTKPKLWLRSYDYHYSLY
ncbi:hypothetical protein GA0061100_11874 [Rhizobium hainanense]|uniref:Uncharacterized protein n=2 Tax=Rhizobium hainanense TaxID=52131 RepID=A0A1C3WGS4_9HYPH|nr:hypothetical protein GA0061100_11874 [Rhizobium hainanense]